MQVYKKVLGDIKTAYKEVESSQGGSKLRELILRATTTLENGLAKMSNVIEKSHQEVRRDVTSVLEQHHDSRTARNIGDAVGDYFKKQWAQINQVFENFAGNTKKSWAELMVEVNPILDRVQHRGVELLEDTKAAAALLRKSALKNLDHTIAKMLATANLAVQDGKLVFDLLRKHLEKFATEL